MAMPVSGVPTETPATQAPELGSGRALGRIGRAVRLQPQGDHRLRPAR